LDSSEISDRLFQASIMKYMRTVLLLTLVDGTDRFSQNVGKELQLLAA